MEEQIRAIMEGRSLVAAELLPSVRQWLDWKITGVLPREGGTLDQDPVFMQDLREIAKLETQLEQNKSELAKLKAEIMKKAGRS